MAKRCMKKCSRLPLPLLLLSLQPCPTLCDPIDGSPPGSSVPGVLQARILEWVAISFSNAWKWKVKGKSLSRVWLLATPWTVAYQAPPSTGFSRQEYWSGLPFLQIKTMRYHLTLIRMVTIKHQQIINVGESMKKREPCYTVGNVNW